MIPDEAVEAAHKAWREQAGTEGTIFEYNLRAALEAAAPHIQAQALDGLADQLDTLWYLRKERMYQQRDWADGVEESETLAKKMAADLRGQAT